MPQLHDQTEFPPNYTKDSPNGTRMRQRLLIGGSMLALVGVLCCGLAVFGGFQLFQGIEAEREAIQPTLRAFLEAGELADASAAIALFADDAATQVSVGDLARLFQERPELFAGFSNVTVETINVTRGTIGTIGRVEGHVTYEGDASQRTYTATLRKEGEAWKLVSIQFPEGVGQ